MQLEQQVKRLQDTSDANSQVVKGKMDNLDGKQSQEPVTHVSCSPCSTTQRSTLAT